MATVKKPSFVVVYEGKNITKDISSNILFIRYSDKTEGASDDMEIVVEDSAGLWRSDWYPTKGDKVQLSIGYDGDLINCGTFEVDEINLSGGGGRGDEIAIRGIAAGVTGKLRTKNSSAHEKKTLKQIADTIAKNNDLTVEGDILDITFDRVTQNNETDLEFLKRISYEYGHIFSVRDKKIIFTVIYEIEKGEAVVSINRGDLKSYNIKDTTAKSFKDAKVSYHNPKTRKVVEQTYNTVERTNADGVTYKEITKGDTLVIKTKAENPQQAKEKAKAALYRANTKQQEGDIEIVGSPLVVAGNNIEITGMGQVSGRFHVVESNHTITKGGGYTTSAKIKRVGFVELVKQKKKKEIDYSKYDIKVIQ